MFFKYVFSPRWKGRGGKLWSGTKALFKDIDYSDDPDNQLPTDEGKEKRAAYFKTTINYYQLPTDEGKEKRAAYFKTTIN
jgi:hypothetical protein